MTNERENQNMAHKCWACFEEFNENDDLIFKNGKIYHQACCTNNSFDEQVHGLCNGYPYLNKTQVEGIFTSEGYEAFRKFDEFDWMIIFEGRNSTEMICSGYHSEIEIKEAIKRHYRESEGMWDIESIFRCGKEYRYTTDIVIDLKVKEYAHNGKK
jgi:hypothetical protein